jgi:methyl-accepting chemotaxis protein
MVGADTVCVSTITVEYGCRIMSGQGEQISLKQRLEFIGLDHKGREALKQLQPLIRQAVGPALDSFYSKVKQEPETRRFFHDDSHMASAKSRQEQHWGMIASAAYDEAYVRGVQTVGKTHARIGLAPRWYIGGYATIVDQLIHAIMKAHWPGMAGLRKGGSEKVAELVSSVVKAALLDVELAVSGYIETLDHQREEAEEAGHQAVARERAIVSGSFGVSLAKLADKDLTHRLTGDVPEAYRELKDNFNTAADHLVDALRSVAGSAGNILSGTHDISSASDDLARRTEQQAASLEETAAALGEITSTVKKAAESAAHASRVVATAKDDAEKSGLVVRKAVEAMTAIAGSSQEISQIIGVIDEIAFQTNLLALNAGVEAARAGESGRGFAVVASEVRALAQRSAEAAKQIKGLISTSSTQVGQGVDLVAETGAALERIVAQVKEINDVVAQIAAGAREQASGLDEVNAAINQMDQVTQQNAAMVEEATASIQALSQETDQLSDMIAHFHIGNIPAARGATPPKRRRAAAG